MSRNARTIRIDRPGRHASDPVDLEIIEQAVTFALAGIARLPDPHRGGERLASVIADLASATETPIDLSSPLITVRSTHS